MERLPIITPTGMIIFATAVHKSNIKTAIIVYDGTEEPFYISYTSGVKVDKVLALMRKHFIECPIMTTRMYENVNYAHSSHRTETETYVNWFVMPEDKEVKDG